MRCNYLFSSILLSCACWRPVDAQPSVMRFDHISIEQGLSDLTVYSFAQDSSGFLWLGTADGLNRYDGHTFTVFRTDPTDSTSMAPGEITSLCVDHSGSLWIGTGNGLSLLTPDSASPHRVPITTQPGSPPPTKVNWLETLKNGDVAIGTWGGLFVYKKKESEFTRAAFDTFEPLIVTTITEARDGILWVGTVDRGLIAFNPIDGSYHQFPHNEKDPTMLHGNVVSRVVEDRSGKIWVATSTCVSRLDPATQSFTRYTQKKGLAEDFVFDILEDHNGTIWVGTFHLGLARYRPESDDFVRYTHDPEDPQSINSDRLTRMFEDRGGVLWCATYRGGLNRHNAKRRAFTHFVARNTPHLGLSGNGVYAILEDRYNDVWMGTFEGGLNRYNPDTGRYTYYRHLATNRHGISSDNILSIMESGPDNIWVGGSGELDRFDHRTARFVHYPMANEGQRRGPEREVKCILNGSDGYLWFGTFYGGLHRLDPTSGETHHYKYLGGDSLSPGSPGIWALREDSRGRLWMGSYGAGLFVLDKQTGTFTQFTHDDAHPMTSLSNNGVYSILKDEKGILWIGTMGGGLNRLDPETGVFRHFTINDGLPNNFVKGIRQDAHGYLWLSTDFGLSRFDPGTGIFMNIKAEDGLMGNVFLSGAHFIGKRGQLFFGGEKGAVAFHPDSIKGNSHVPPVVITSFRVLDRPHPLHRSQTYPHDMNSVSFEFVALDFTLPERNHYAYMMMGVDQDWVAAGTRRYANYPHLDPGTYTFRVKGSNNDGVWNERGTSFTFIIGSPFWGTWWFQLGFIALVASAGVWLYNYRVNRLLEIERLRVKIASDLHDDIGSSLTRISLQSELIQEGIEPEEVSTYLKNIAATSRELVSTMSDIVWSIDARNDLVENLLMRIRDCALNTLTPKSIEVHFAHSGLDGKKSLSVDKRENIYLVCKEAINNIAKHSGATRVSIVIRNDHDKFNVLIQDDGKGLGGGRGHSGHGMKNMRMRAERLGGAVEFISHGGTRVILTTARL